MVETGARNSAVKSTVSSHAQEASGMEPTRVWVGAARLTSSSEAGTGRPGAAGALEGWGWISATSRTATRWRHGSGQFRRCGCAEAIGGSVQARGQREPAVELEAHFLAGGLDVPAHGRCAWAAEGRLAAAAVRRAAEVAGPGEGVPAKAAVSRARETGPDAARRARLVSHQSSVGRGSAPRGKSLRRHVADSCPEERHVERRVRCALDRAERRAAACPWKWLWKRLRGARRVRVAAAAAVDRHGRRRVGGVGPRRGWARSSVGVEKGVDCQGRARVNELGCRAVWPRCAAQGASWVGQAGHCAGEARKMVWMAAPGPKRRTLARRVCRMQRSRQVGQLGRSAPPAESAGAGETTGGAGAAGGNGAGETLEPKGCCGPPPPAAPVAAKALVGHVLRGRLPWHARLVVSVLCFFFLCVCVFFVFLCFGLGFDLIPGGTEIAGPGCLEKDGKERLEARWGRGGEGRALEKGGGECLCCLESAAHEARRKAAELPNAAKGWRTRKGTAQRQRKDWPRRVMRC